MRKLSNNGFTLPEVIVTIVISSIVMLALISFTTTIGKVYVENSNENEQRLMMSVIKEYLKNEFTLVKKIEPTGDATFRKLEFKNNSIFKNNADVFDANFYGNNKITATVKGLDSFLTFYLTIESANGKNLTEEFIVKTLNKANIDIPNPISTIYYKNE